MTNLNKDKLIVICGPTGIGKTDLSLSLAQEFYGSIVGADSMQIFRHMDVGTAKPSPEEMAQVPHYMIDIVDPDQTFDAAMFYKLGRQAIQEIYEQGRVPFVVGGTGFYLKALLHGLFESTPVDPEIINRLKQEADGHGIGIIYGRLSECDPEAADRIHPNDAYRVIRAMAVYEMSGKPMSEFQQAHGFKQCPFDVLKICLFKDRESLYERINRRVDLMVEAGLVGEVKKLLEMGYSGELRPMQAIGYRHMVDFIEGRVGWEETVELLKRDTRRFAKRQLTWFRKDPEMIWKSPEEGGEIRRLVKKFLEGEDGF